MIISGIIFSTFQLLKSNYIRRGMKVDFDTNILLFLFNPIY